VNVFIVVVHDEDAEFALVHGSPLERASTGISTISNQ